MHPRSDQVLGGQVLLEHRRGAQAEDIRFEVHEQVREFGNRPDRVPASRLKRDVRLVFQLVARLQVLQGELGRA